jgi:2-C-methyl-D-erythritol 4-phosphate cytidylyltransferase
VKRAEDGRVIATLDRKAIWLAQTPQAFHTSLFRRAYQEAASAQITVTDDAAIVERLGVPVHLVPGSPDNIKVTTASDLIVAEALLAQREAEST